MLLISNSTLIRKSLVELISEKNYGPVESATFDQFEDQLYIHILEQTSLIILDLSSLADNSLNYLRRIRKRSLSSRIVVLHVYHQDQLIAPLLEAGADSYIPIDNLDEQFDEVLAPLKNGLI